MINNLSKNLKILCAVLICLFANLILSWCWDSPANTDNVLLEVNWFNLTYNSKKTKLEKVWLKTDDLGEIVDLYQEVWENLEYRDSLLVAEKYAQWLWANAFAQDNLESLQNQWLAISNIKKTQIWFEKKWKKIYAVLIEYEITQWLVDDLPLLYVSQIFVPMDNDMILMSYITENKSSRSNASDMFKNIK